MKRFALICLLALGLGSPVMAADPLEGIWQTAKDDNGNFGHIQIAPCGDKLCGTLVQAFDSSGTPVQSDNVGKQIVWDMIAQGEGAYAKGKIWSPDRDKTYKSKMQLNGNGVVVMGCVLGICREGGTWKRVP